MQYSDVEFRDRSKERCCYSCGAQERLTRDHIPPRNLFPQPRLMNRLIQGLDDRVEVLGVGAG
jgi:hypothetical protein